jgi:NAD-dependent dihydropyrimidine dehydrogenase PreA subunit
MKSVRKIIEINEELCNGCGQCVPDCAEGSLKIVDGKAKLVADKLCDGLGACLGSCPTGALKIVEREADEFDEEAVEEFLAKEKAASETKEKPKTMDCGCASTHIQTFAPRPAMSPCQAANAPKVAARGGASELTHWPVQIRLIPAHAPFLQNADVLVAADCTAVAVRNFQEKYLAGKTVMMGCPKFDDAESYVQRFTEIIMCFPSFMLIMTMVVVLKPSLFNVMLIIGLFGWTDIVRLVRGQILSIRERDYITAARMIGQKERTILFKHVLPGTISPIVVRATLGLSGAIMLESGLSFLGIGVQAPQASWGSMLTTAMLLPVLDSKPWRWVPPAAALAIVVLAVNFIGDALRDALDPHTSEH